jgi:osmotically-inducible protein OsmY
MSVTTSSALDRQIERVIVHHPHLVQRRVHFRSAPNGRVTLEGEVASWFEKQLAQEAVRQVAGVTAVDNALQVRPVEID